MARYRECPNCGNTEKWTDIYQCKGCGKVFCSHCGRMSKGDWMFFGLTKLAGMGGDKCPFCGTEGFFKIRTLGHIE